jgi:hypothetical protein
MTPFELSLQIELDTEYHRFDSEWLFRWHGLSYKGGLTDVDDFKGGRIRAGGVKYEYQLQQIFWQTLSRYLAQKVHESFKRWDAETKSYPLEKRLLSLNGTEGTVTHFARQIVKRGIETDRALRGGGNPQSVRPYNSAGSVAAIAEVNRLALAHRDLIEQAMAEAKRAAEQSKSVSGRPIWKWLERSYAENKALIWLLGIVFTVGGAGLSYLVGRGFIPIP